MKNRKILLPALLSIALVFSLILPASVVRASATVHLRDERSISHLSVGSSSLVSAMALNMSQNQVTPMVVAGFFHTVGLKNDGTVVAVGDNSSGQCDVGGWMDITQVAAGMRHTVGLKSDGTVVAVGQHYFGQCNIGSWTDITQIGAGYIHTVGLKSDGTVIAVGYNDDKQCNVDRWTNITQVAAGFGHTVGLKNDDTVVAVGYKGYGQCDFSGWLDIIQIAAGSFHTVGLKNDGSVAAVGYNDYEQCNVGNWTNITQVTAGDYHTVGLKNDGTVIAVGYNAYEQCNLFDWDLEIIKYALTISSTAGGCVTAPDGGTPIRDEETVVNLVAEAEEGYRFVSWTGDVDTIANIESAATNITMHGDYSITANFEEIPLPPMNWPLIGGIIAGVVAVGLVIFFVRKRGRGPA